MTGRSLAGIMLATTVLIGTVVAQSRPPSTATGEWPTYGGDLANSKYSPLDINASNFSSLRIAWRMQGRTATEVPELVALALP